MKTTHLNLRAAMVSLLMFLVFLGAWQLSATAPTVAGAAKAGMTADEIEYQKMMGKDPGAVKSTGFPPPLEVGKAIAGHLADPFYDKGPNDKGIAIQLGHSLARVGLGFLLACLVAVPLGLLMGSFRIVQAFLEPLVNFIRYLPVTSFVPLFILWIGIGISSGVSRQA